MTNPPSLSNPLIRPAIDTRTRECWCVYCERSGSGVFADLRAASRPSRPAKLPPAWRAADGR